MSLTRTALRITTVAALRGDTPTTGPTIARNRVYDSRVDDFAPESRPGDTHPTVIVLTDEDEGDAMSRQNGGPPFERMVSLVIEFAIVQTMELKFEVDGVTKTEFVAGYPSTDSEHEASLDLLEYQIKQRLASDLASPFSVLWRKQARVWKYNNHRQVINDAGEKLAARILTWECQIDDDDKPKTVNPNTDAEPTGLDLLPEPLRTVALALPPGSLLDTCTSLANALSPIVLTPLDGVDMQVRQGTDEDPLTMLDVSIEIASAQDTPQVVASGGPVTIDYARGTFQHLILAANVASLQIKNWPKNGQTGRLILKITNTGNFDVAPTAWPAGTMWVDGAEPSITQGAGKIDMIVLVSGSAGAEIFANIIGQDYQP